jgi:hypothetical protein
VVVPILTASVWRTGSSAGLHVETGCGGHTDGSETCEQDDKEQLVPVVRARLEIGRPVSGVNVGYCSDEARSNEAKMP